MKPQNELNKNQLSNSRLHIWLAFFSIIISIILLSPNTVKAQYNPFTKITDDDFPQYNPVIDGDYVVYEDRRDGGVGNLYLYDIVTGTETKLTSDPAVMSVHADISGDRIVWQDNRNGNWDIYTYLISRPDLGAYPLIDFPGDQTSPAIHGNTLVWADHRGDQFSANIFMYDLSTGDVTQITDDNDLQQWDPDVYEHLIVYGDGRNGNQDIYMYNTYTGEETQLTDDPAIQKNPSIHGRRVVWEDNRDGNWNLYMHHTTFMLGTVYDNFDWVIHTADVFPGQSSDDEINPCIWGDFIIFQDNRNGHWDLYMYSFFNAIYGHTTPLVTEDKDQINPAISNNRVVWQDERDWNGVSNYEADIWLWDRPPGADLGISILDTPDPIATGNELSYEIFVKNFGTQDATNVVLTNNIPGNVDFLRATSAKGESCNLSGDEIICNIGNLVNGETDTITIVVRTTSEGILTNTATVTATEDDPVSENNSTSAKTTVKWNISNIIDSGHRPSMATDANGKVHVSYISDNYEGDLLYATNRTGNWVSETLISSGNIQSHAIAIDKNGDAHIVYGDGDYGHQELMYITNTSGDWSTPVIVEPNALECVSVCIKSDSENNIHISYMTSPWSNGSLYYLKNTTGSWSSEMIEQNSYNSSSFDLDTSGYAHFSYYNMSMGSGITYRTNSPDGIWKNAVAVEDDWQGGQLESLITDIAVDLESKPQISYVGAEPAWGNEDTKYAYLEGGQWYDTIIDDGKFYGSFNVIDTDLNSKAHIVYNYLTTSEIRYATNAEGSWETHLLEPNSDHVFDLNERDIHDINADALGYVHIVYSKEGTLYYVTNKPPAPEPEIIVTPQSIDFVIRAVGDTTEARKVIIKNKGDANLQINDISIVWPDSIQFTITNNTCSNLAPSDTCSVDVVFNPKTLGDKKALLWIESNDPANPTESVILEGKGLAPMVRDYGSLAFGDVTIGHSASSVYTIKNIGNSNLQIQMVTIQEDDASDFYYTDLPEPPFNIGENDSIMFNIVFKPGSVGGKTTILRIFTNDLDLTRILTGTGTTPSFTVEGKLMIDESTPVNSGDIYVYQLINETAVAGWSKSLSGFNSFIFSDIPKGIITLRLDPDTIAYPGYLNTYLGNTPVYADAEFFNLVKDTSGLEITLVQAPPPPNGNSEISGIFVEEDGTKSGSTMTYGTYNGSGTPVSETSVFLFDKNGDILDLDTTKSTGEFVFENIPIGRYKFVADYVGFLMDNTNDSLIISQENQKFSIAAIANNNMITIEVENVTGITSLTETSGIYVYPNPASDHIILQFDSNMPADEYILKINSMTGKTLQKKTMQVHDSSQEFTIRIDDLPGGIYIISLSGNKTIYKARFIKVE